MRFTKFGRSCVRLEKDGAVLVVDPGVWTDAAAGLAGAAAVMVTREPADHLDADAVRTALQASPELTLWANPQVTAQFTEFGDRVHELRHGDVLSAAGFGVHLYGHGHALMHKDIPQVVNTGFLIEGELFHPGDWFAVPEEPVRTLLVPVAGPWLWVGAMIDYFRAVAPVHGYAIHDAILNDNGLGLMTRMLLVAPVPSGVPVARLEPGTSLEV
jgi:L-ascorbate metabolism protein UlaG (beta-lactamase superfamily)